MSKGEKADIKKKNHFFSSNKSRNVSLSSSINLKFLDERLKLDFMETLFWII